jgi:hypothetical protein
MHAPWGSGDCSGRNTLTPALSQRERGPIFVALKREFDSIFQVGGEFQSPSPQPLPLGEGWGEGLLKR